MNGWDALPGVNQMRGMQYKSFLINITLIMHFLRADNCACATAQIFG